MLNMSNDSNWLDHMLIIGLLIHHLLYNIYLKARLLKFQIHLKMKSIILLGLVSGEEQEKIIERYYIDTGLGEAVLEKDND